MKKIFSFLGVFLIVSLIILACNRIESSENITTETERSSNVVLRSAESSNDMGEIHNTVLKEYYRLYSEDDTDDLILMNKRLNNISVSLYPTKFSIIPDEEIENFTNIAYGATDANNFNYSQHSINSLEEALSNGYISSDFHETMKPLIISSPSFEYTLNVLENYKTDLKTKPESEIKNRETDIINGMISIYKGSHDLWTNNDPTPYAPLQRNLLGGCDPEDQIALADTWGGFMGGTVGLFGSPAGGIALGYLASWGFSKAVMVQIKKNGGRCM